jgi:hypothetical protein
LKSGKRHPLFPFRPRIPNRWCPAESADSHTQVNAQSLGSAH